MHKHILNSIIDEFQTDQCLRDVEAHWRFRSTVPGPAFRAACHNLATRHREHGMDVTLTTFPADDKTEWLGGARIPLEWTPRSAELSIVSPHSELLCSFATEPLCLVSSSTGTPQGGVRAEVIVVDSGASESDYGGQDVRGKIIFTSSFWNADGYARAHGALGVISDTVSPPWINPPREPTDIPDLTQWRTFSGSRETNGLWGFMLSPLQGRRLRDLIQSSPTPVILHAEVDAELKEGVAEFVHARLPGTDLAHEEIWVMAHASEPGARDNASGCALSLELGRTLKALIDSGRLPPLRRSIRFLHGVEVCGYTPYIDSRLADMENVIAGINLDSVGQDFNIAGGDCILIRSDEKNASFVDSLLSHLFAVVADEPNRRFTRDNYDTFPWHVIGFRGDDACISDGYFDIPTPGIFTWPDRFYHTNMDTVDQMSANTMGRNAAIAGTYLYLLATMGPEHVPWLTQLTLRDWKQRIVDDLTKVLTVNGTTSVDLRSRGEHLAYQGQDALTHILQFAPGDKMARCIVQKAAQELMRFGTTEGAVAASLTGQSTAVTTTSAAASLGDVGVIVYKRTCWNHPKPEAFSQEGRITLLELQSHGDIQQVWSWINGRRTFGEAYARAGFIGTAPASVICDYINLLERESFVRRVTDPQPLPRAV